MSLTEITGWMVGCGAVALCLMVFYHGPTAIHGHSYHESSLDFYTQKQLLAEIARDIKKIKCSYCGHGDVIHRQDGQKTR